MTSTASQTSIQPVPELVAPDYNLYKYRSDMYKVVRFKSTRPRLGRVELEDQEEEELPEPSEEQQARMTAHAEKRKFSQALSRARRVCLELALCNDWKWFATFTIAENNYDRKNLDGYYEKFSEWLKYQKKKYKIKIPYLLVPEQHGDGSWHMHGFFGGDIDRFLKTFKQMDAEGYRGPDGKRLPPKLIERNYWNWPEYQEKFGFCSFGEIQNQDATAFYATKYISKSFQGDAPRVGLKLYYCSQGLNRASYFDSVYGPCAELDKCLTHHYEWCSTGFYSFQREPGDDPLLDILEANQDLMVPLQYNPWQDPGSAGEPVQDAHPEVMEYYETMQELLKRLES